MSASATSVLVGVALGDSLGLPMEGMSRKKVARLGWKALRHRFVAGRGMWSDDTEHSLLVARALLAEPEDEKAFARHLAWGLRWWFLALPAGAGLATARACLKLWLGIPPNRSGVFSAGNGPAMRSGVIGAFFSGNESRRRAFVRSSVELTHTDPKALVGALAVAELTSLAVAGGVPSWKRSSKVLQNLAPKDRDWIRLLETMDRGLKETWSVERFADEICRKPEVSGYVYESVPLALFACFRRGFRWDLLPELYRVGGDADTVGAIAGGLIGVAQDGDSLPTALFDELWEWPAGKATLLGLGQALDGQREESPRRRFPILIFARNLVFLFLVLVNGFLRLVPKGPRLLAGREPKQNPTDQPGKR